MNIKTKHLLIPFFVVLAMFANSIETKAQCFQVYDGSGIVQTTPYFIGCSGLDYTIFIQTDIALGNYTINWGDGTANTTGTSLTPPAFIQHTYAAVVDTFDITTLASESFSYTA